MSFNYKLASVLVAVVLSGCGGGGSSSDDLTQLSQPLVPFIDDTPPTLEISASDLMVNAGETLEFVVTATDNVGFGTTAVVCGTGGVSTSLQATATIQTVTVSFEAPDSEGTVSCFATSSDNSGNSTNLDFLIAVNPGDNEAPSLSISPANLTVVAGENLMFDVIAVDSSGFDSTSVTCAEGTVSTTTTTEGDTQTVSTSFGAPATAGTVDCVATSVDSNGNTGDLDFSIIVAPVAVVTANFNGTWFSPCFNNTFGFSVRQAITINGTSLASAIESFTAGSTPAPNCTLPNGEGLVISSDVTGMLDFQQDIDLSGCINDRAVETGISLETFDSSGNSTVTEEQDIIENIETVTGSVDILPGATDICLLDNENLLFAGVEYTGDADTNINVIINPDFDIAAAVSWSFGENDYAAETASSGVDAGDGTTGILSVSTLTDTSNGAFSGSGLDFTHTLQGSGVYRLTTLTEVITADPEDETAKLVNLNGTVGQDADGGTTIYGSSADGGFIVVILDDEGLYHFSTAQTVTLPMTAEVDGGVEGAPEAFELEMTNIFDFDN